MQQTFDLEAEKKEILKRYRGLLRACKKTRDNLDKKKIRKAFDVAHEAHSEMRRKSGEPYIYHPIEVARITGEEIGLGTTSIICALLHDTVEDTDITVEDVDQMFGPKVAKIVDGLTKISGLIDHSDPNFSLQAENFRKMLLTLSDDIRVILIKLADRLHNMRTMEHMPRHKQLKISYETLSIYAPLAHRLGLNTIKSELENLGLKYTEPELYEEINGKLIASEKARNRFINKFSLPIINSLSDQGFSFDIKGRPKSIYSIANKIKNKGVTFDEIYDIFAIRLIIDSENEDSEKPDCWRAYSVVTDHYTPRPERLRDWISTPKSNGYESLHTTVMGPDGRWVEVQIRSRRMNDIAERGLAAHWKYKGGGNSESKFDDWIKKITEILDNPSPSALDFIDDFKLNVFAEEIFIFTPQGDLKTLPKNATCLDFAYEIHTQVGNKCIGAKVNHKLVPLNYKLKSGEQIEVLTSKKQIPKEDWLKIVVTHKAKSHIKDALKKEKKKIFEDGKELLKQKLHKLKIQLDQKLINQLKQYFQQKSSIDLYYSVAIGNIDMKRVKEFVSWKKKTEEKKKTQKKKVVTPKDKSPVKKGDTLIIGDDNGKLDYTLSQCCNPIPGDEVFGFVTINEGIKVHKAACPNAMNLLSRFAYRVVKAHWQNQKEVAFLTRISIKGADDIGLVNNITRFISEESNVNMKSLAFDTNNGLFEGHIKLFANDTLHLMHLIDNINKLNGVISVKRSDEPS